MSAVSRVVVSLELRRLSPWLWTVLRWAPVPIAIGVLFGAWELYVELSGIEPQVLPSPSRVIREGWDFRSDLVHGAGFTLREAAIGFAVSVGAATLIAIAMDFSGAGRRALYPLLVGSQTLPLIVLAPLMIVWFGFGLTPKVLLVVLVTFFPIVVGWIDGFASTEDEARNLLRTMGAGRWQTFRYLRFPNALPRFFSGLRIAITYAVVAAVIAEWAGARLGEGLGVLMIQYENSFRTDLVLAAVFVTAGISIALFLSTYALERAAIPWYFRTRRRG